MKDVYKRQDRYYYGTIGDDGKVSYCPMSAITPADGYFISLLNAGIFQQDMYFLYFTGHISVL